MKKNTKTNRVQFRCDEQDYYFLQSLREKGMTISSYLTNCIKLTETYRHYDCMMNG